jgi:hypothetical protein
MNSQSNRVVPKPINCGFDGDARVSDNHAANDSSRRRLAAGACVEPIVECIRKMRLEGLADSEIAGLFRHTADELDEGTTSKDGKVGPAS